MGYSQVFGGGSINPSQRSYLSLVTAVDVQLQWPIEQQIAGANVAADIIDIDPTAPGLNVDLADARVVSNGFTSLMTNIGANTVTIRDVSGGTIISLLPGTSWFIYLVDNSTLAGVWRTFQLGATVSVASAAALAGAGLKAIATTLNQTVPPTLVAATPINWTISDRAQFTIWTGGLGVLNLPAAGTVGSDWFAMIRNGGSGDLTVTPPAGTIDSAATLVMAPGTSATIVTDGTNFFTLGLGTSTSGTFDFVQISVPGSGDFVLSGVQLNRISYRFIGILTGNRNIVVPNTVQQYWVDNQTTGAFQLFVKTAAQITGVEVLQNNQIILYCDSTDVINASSSTLTPPITVGQGGTGAITAAGAMTNLGVGRSLNTPALSGLAGGGNLSVDRNLAINTDNLTTELVLNLVADTLAFYDDSAAAMRKTPLSNIAAITVQEEGVTVGTLASILNFVGGVVTATGAGATKTIAIPISAPSAINHLLRDNGAGAWVDAGANILIDNIGRLNLLQNSFIDAAMQFRVNSTDYSSLSSAGVETSMSAQGAVTGFRFSGYDLVEIDGGNLKMFEVAAPQADEAGYAQLWIEDTAANMLRYTDDSGTDMFVETTQFIVKAADETVNNSSTYQTDNHMVGIQMDAGATYRIRIGCFVAQSSAVPDFKVRIIGDGAGTIVAAAFGAWSAPAGGTGNVIGDAQPSAQAIIATSVGDNYVMLEGTALIGNGDTFHVEWAQVTANASDTVLQNNSYIEVTKILG